VLALLAVGAAAPGAAAQTTAPESGAMAPGGSPYTAPPVVKKVRCVKGCASRKRLRGGSTARLEGRYLAGVTKVTFHGSAGRRDDRRVAVKPGTATRLRVQVPLSAVSGPVSVQVSRTVKSRRTRAVKILPAPEIEPNPVLSPVPGTGQNGTPRLETATSRTKFYFAGSNVRFSYRVTHPSPVSVTVDLLRTDGSVAYTWSPGAAPPGQTLSVLWRGTLNGSPAPPGRYSFRLNAASPTGARARSSSTGPGTSRDAFDLFPHIFPVRGRHNFGQSGARFGAGRGGRSHQGQDVMAKCGTRLVAARGGKVKAKGYQRAAGNYLVITGSRAGHDYAYMHLTEPSAFDRGDRVLTGQRIGTVGDTGNARGCHLHFELWRKPGWYSGGRPFNPLPALRDWDSYS
jgi:murein DD-endopeptidase MepM/ murein hydrolase activator NlpD